MRFVIRLFAFFDWLVLRAIGFALLGTAYLIAVAVQEERPVEPAALTWGQEPLHALVFYGVLGLLLAVPVLLPRSVLVPTNLFKGLIKSAFVAGGAVAAMPALVPLLAFVPSVTLPADATALIPAEAAALIPAEAAALIPADATSLLSMAPTALQAMAAFSIFCALIAGLVGQFGRKRRYDYAGNPIVELSPSELRQLRAARMGVNA